MSAIQRDFGPKGVQVLMSATDAAGPGVVSRFVQQFQPNYPVGWNDISQALTFLGVSLMTPGYVPKMAFMDRKGVIRHQYFGEDAYFKDQDKSIRGTLDEMVKEYPAAQAKRKAPRAGKSH